MTKQNILLNDNTFDNMNASSKPKIDRNRVIDTYKREFLIKDKHMPILEKEYPSHEKEFLKGIMKYRDRWIDILSSIYPCDYPIFGDNEQKALFECTGINPKELNSTIKMVTLPKGVDTKANFTPIFTTILMIIHYYLKKEDLEKLHLVARYLSYSMYWSIFTRSFSVSNPNRGVMEYTINRINNKFIIKQLGSVDNLLFYCTLGSLKNNADILEEFFDYAICYIIDGVKGAIGGKVKGIASEYYDDYNNRATIFMGNDDMNFESRSSSMDVESYASQYASKFFSEDPRRDLTKVASAIASVSELELLSTIRLLLDNNNTSDVQKFYECLFYAYFKDTGDNNLTDKKKFCNNAYAIYKKSHSKDKNDMEIRNLLNKWLMDGSSTFAKTKRDGTRNDYRRAVFMYFVLLVATKE